MMKCIINTYKGYRVHDRYWQPYTLYLLPFTLYLLLFCSCENRELSADDPCGDAAAVEVVTFKHGYYYGTWEETVHEQIAGALGEHGTPEEQAAWRLQNGGYDIVLQNDGRLVIPDEPDDGTFIVDVDDYDNVIVPLPLR